MAQKDKSSTKKDGAGRRFIITRPKFRFTWSWHQASSDIHVFVLNTVAFIVGLAKQAKGLAPEDNGLWADLLVFLIFMSTTLAVSNSLHETDEKEKTWNWFKFLLVAALVGVNITILILSYSKKADNIVTNKDKKGGFGDNQVIFFLFSSIISSASSHIKLVQREIEPVPDDVEFGPQTLDQLKEAIGDHESTIKTIVGMMEKQWRTDHRLIRDNDLLLTWSTRVDHQD